MELVIKSFVQLTAEEVYKILRVRQDVFVVEQVCPYPDIDGVDECAIHAFLRDETGIKAYLRVFERAEDTAQIGRMLTVQRGTGLGRELLKDGIRIAKEMLQKNAVYLEGQSYALGFYEKEEFREISEEFLEDGIPHVKMLLELEGNHDCC